MKLKQQSNGFIEPITIAIIIVCLSIGGIYMLKSKRIDAPGEQAVEAILRNEGIDIDFSASKKEQRDTN